MNRRLTVMVLLGQMLATGCMSTGRNPEHQHLVSSEPCRCAHKAPEIESSKAGSSNTLDELTLNVRIGREPSSLLSIVEHDPIIASIVDHQITESLVRKSPNNGQIVPELALSFIIDNIENTYTFFLNDKATWHDGRPLTSYDVAFVFSRLLDPYGGLVSSRIIDSISDVWTPDEGTIVFRLDNRGADFFEFLETVPILPAHVFGRTPIALHSGARAPIGSGPLRFVRWVPSRYIEFERNPNYRGKAPLASTIRYHIVPDDRIALDMFRRGELDIVPDLPASAAFDAKLGQLHTYRLPHIESWVFNVHHSVLSQVEVRQAIGMLIDRETIRCAILRCKADIVANPWASGGSEEIPSQGEQSSYQPEAAEQLLDDSGWIQSGKNGIRKKNGTRLEFSLLLSDTSRDLERIATVIQGDLANVGITMRIVRVSRGAFIERLDDGRFDAAALSLPNRSGLDAWSLLHSDAIDGDGNFGGYSDARTDDFLNQLYLTQDNPSRAKLATALQRRISKEQPMIVLLVPYGTALVRPGIIGFSMHDGWFDIGKLKPGGGGV